MDKRGFTDKRRLYGDLAWTWPIISPPQEYVNETRESVRLIREYSKIPVSSALNLGCGGGHHDHTMKQYFQLTGVDISEPMLDLARQLNPEVIYINGDMRSVRLGSSFDAVTIFDSINYMRSPESLKAALTTAFAHLRPGGVFLTTPEIWQENFVQNKTYCFTRRCGEVEITFIEYHYDPDPEDNSYEANFIYLIRKSGELTIEHDCHLMGIFNLETWPRLLGQVGFEVHQIQSTEPDPEGNYLPVLIGVKPV